MIVQELTLGQYQQRCNIRNAFLCEDVTVIRAAMATQDEFGKSCLQEMLDECKQHSVDNYGKTPAF